MQSDTPTAAPASEAKLHFLDYLRIIRVRKMIIIMVWLLVIITTVVVTNWLPKTYMSFVKIDVQKDVSDIELIGRMQNTGSFDPYFIQTQFELIKSSSVLYKVIEQLNLNQRWAKRYGSDTPLQTRETYTQLEKRLDVRNVRNTSLIEIRVYSEDKEEAADIANRVADVYRDNRLEQTKTLSDEGIKKLNEQLLEKKKEVELAGAKAEKLRKESKLIDIGALDSGGPSVAFDQSAVIQAETSRSIANQKFIDLDTKYKELMKLGTRERSQAILTVGNYDDNLAQLINKLNAAEQDRALKVKDFGPEHVEMQKINNLISDIEKQIEARVAGIMNGMQATVAAAKAQHDTLQEEVNRFKERIQSTQNAAQEFLLAKREAEQAKQIHDGLNSKIQQEIINGSIGRRMIVQVTDRAEVGLKPVRPNMLINVTLGVIVGLMLGVGLAFFIEYLDTSVKTIDDVERALQSTVLGVIPQNVGAIMDEGPESPHSEAYRVLRTNLIFARKDPSLNTITVVSGGAGEGKSTTIMNLATIFAQNGQRVLLVDSDLRRPSLHKRFNVSNALGLTNYLLKQNKLEEIIQTTPVSGLDFLPSGKLPSSSLGILNSPQMKEFVTEIKKRYDFVFFDSPPIMGVSDAAVLVSEMDMTLLVIQYRKYPQAMTVRSKQMVDKAGGNLVGVVLNNINISQDAYYYYYSGYAYNNAERDDDEKPAKKGGKSTAAEPAKVEIKQKY